MPIPPDASRASTPTDLAPARGVYRTPLAFDGLVVFIITDSRGHLRRRDEVHESDATPEFEDELIAWLDRVDPVPLRLVS